MTGKYSGESRKILTQEEKEIWLDFLRGDRPIEGLREQIASILEEYFKREDHSGGHRPKSKFEINRERNHLLHLSNLVCGEMQFAGKSYDQAIREVANRKGLKYTSFKKDLGKLRKLTERTAEPELPQEVKEWERERDEEFLRMVWKQWRAENPKRKHPR
jgi:hypothetical protein